jgi:hypothetical protein
MNINANAMIQKAQADNSVDWMGAAQNVLDDNGLWGGIQMRKQDTATRKWMEDQGERQDALNQAILNLRGPND